jgi:hypothetical protein
VALFHFGFAHGDPRRPRRGSPPCLLGVAAVLKIPTHLKRPELSYSAFASEQRARLFDGLRLTVAMKTPFG